MTSEYREALAALRKRADHVRAAQDRAEAEAKSPKVDVATSAAAAPVRIHESITDTIERPAVAEDEGAPRDADPKRERGA
jgi:hypothetical protein